MMMKDLSGGEIGLIISCPNKQSRFIGTLVVRNSKHTSTRYQMVGRDDGFSENTATNGVDEWEVINVTDEILEGVKNATK